MENVGLNSVGVLKLELKGLTGFLYFKFVQGFTISPFFLWPRIIAHL